MKHVSDVPIWKCDDCGGPAVWTFIRGVVHYHCEHQCDGFMQVELFESPGVRDPVRGSEPDVPDDLPF